MTKDTLLNQSTEIVLEDSENSNRLAVGLIIMLFFAIVVLGIYASVSYTENKALKSRIDSLRVSNKSLENNLLMPKSIENELEQR